MEQNEKRVLIVGGGFAGVETALTLADKIDGKEGVKIQLLSDKPHFEYHAALYRVVTGKSPLEVCIPLDEIFENREVEILVDTVKEVNLADKKLMGQSGSHYRYDILVLALGSEANYFNIPGIRENAFGFKSITEALKLKRHLHSVCEEISKTESNGSKVQFVVVGAGASGAELSGELAVYLKKLFKQHNLDSSNFEIRLLDAAPKIFGSMPPKYADKIKNRLDKLGIKLETSAQIVEENVDTLFTKSEEIHTKTVIWTAGIQTHRVYKTISGLELDSKGKVVVEPTLLAKGQDNVFVGGDAASAEFSGMAQTAVGHGQTIGENIAAILNGENLKVHEAKKPYYSIPVGPGWAASMHGNSMYFGRMGWWIRRWLDLRFFMTILSPRKAWMVWRSGKKLSESCPECSSNTD
jgi:NADH:ubiquinone reductase (H+-translocating)